MSAGLIMKASVHNHTGSLKTCLDISNKQIADGKYFTPASLPCLECQCVNGLKEHCISFVCKRPSCSDYKEIPGKCCKYICPELSDSTTLAVVISLSCLLMLVLMTTTFFWWKLRRKKTFGTRLNAANSEQMQESDVDLMIQRNSIPNNTRHMNNSKVIETQLQQHASFFKLAKQTNNAMNNTALATIPQNTHLTSPWIPTTLQHETKMCSLNSGCSSKEEYAAFL